MLAARLVRMIEDHAEELTRGVLHELQTNPRTPAYHTLSREELHKRAHDVYSHLGQWLDHKTEERIAKSYEELGRVRCREGVLLSEVAFALVLTKHHLRGYIRSSGLAGSALDLYQEEELNLLIDNFFDKAIYYTVKGYEETRPQLPAARAS